MKTLIILLLLCVSLTGCFPPGRPAMGGTDSTTQAQTESTTQITTVPAAAPAPTEAAPTAPLLAYTLYLPNENADGFVTRPVQTNTINADSVLMELQKTGALPDTVIINAFGAQGDQLILDFNSSFADAVNAMGTSGERMIIGSLVNTFLNAFQAQSVFFTVEGEILESGHVVYDFPLTFFE